MAKRSNGEGTMYKRADGRWCASMYVGKHRRYVYGKTQQEVKTKLKKIQEEADDLDVIAGETNYTLQSWVEKYLNDYKANDIKATTLSTYYIFYRKHILNSDLGKILLKDITTDDLQKYYNQKLKTLSAKTVRHISVITREALMQAYRLRYINNNPHEAVILPPKEHYSGATLTKEDVAKILNDAVDEKCYAAVVTAIYTGMRQGELLGLQWSDVNFEEGYIKIENSLCRVDDGIDEKGKHRTKLVLMEPKTASSRRKIPLADPLKGVLLKHKARQEQYKKDASDYYNFDLDLVFPNYLGDFMRGKDLLNEFHKLLEKYGIQKVRFHDLRHTFASLLLQSGTEGKVVQELLGHSSISTTLDIYSHLTMKQKKDSVEKLSEILK